jgi:DNA-binding transcriptional LysR family regulator
VDVRDLHRFLVISEELNISRSAQRLFMSQPALSRLVRRMEREVGVKLLTRNAHSVALTPAGESFTQRARQLVLDFDRAVADTRAIACGQSDSPFRGFGLVLLWPLGFAMRPSSLSQGLNNLVALCDEEGLISRLVDIALQWPPVYSSYLW